MQQTQPIALFHELVAINRRVMAENLNRLHWGMATSLLLSIGVLTIALSLPGSIGSISRDGAIAL